MKHKVAQLKTEITVNQIKAQWEQRRKDKKQNNSLILHTPRPRARPLVLACLRCHRMTHCF